MLPSRSTWMPWERLKRPSPKPRMNVPSASNSMIGRAPRVSTNRWPSGPKATLAAGPMTTPAGRVTGLGTGTKSSSGAFCGTRSARLDGRCAYAGTHHDRAATATAAALIEPSLPRQRIRTHLELDELALRPHAAFDVPHVVRAVVGVESAALPAGARVVDAAVHPARIEPERVRHAHRHPLARLRIQD